MKAKYKWAVIERTDGGDVIAQHIVPFTVIDGFTTQEAAREFIEKSVAEDCFLTDKDDFIVGSYVGHELTPDCVCEPMMQDGLVPCYLHRMPC